LEVTIDGRSDIAKAGVVAIVPPNTLNSVNALTNGRLIVVDHPSRPDFG
jgi:quercetin dioxygenase-like cupin family protein